MIQTKLFIGEGASNLAVISISAVGYLPGLQVDDNNSWEMDTSGTIFDNKKWVSLGEGASNLATISFSIVHRCIFPQNTVLYNSSCYDESLCYEQISHIDLLHQFHVASC